MRNSINVVSLLVRSERERRYITCTMRESYVSCWSCWSWRCLSSSQRSAASCSSARRCSSVLCCVAISCKWVRCDSVSLRSASAWRRQASSNFIVNYNQANTLTLGKSQISHAKPLISGNKIWNPDHQIHPNPIPCEIPKSQVAVKCHINQNDQQQASHQNNWMIEVRFFHSKLISR